MTNAELNKQAHEALGRGCYHAFELDETANDVDHGYYGFYECSLCHFYCPSYDDAFQQPNYCSSLDAASELERFTIEKVGKEVYGHYLWKELGLGTAFYPRGKAHLLVFDGATAPALTRVKACLAALQSQPEDTAKPDSIELANSFNERLRELVEDVKEAEKHLRNRRDVETPSAPSGQVTGDPNLVRRPVKYDAETGHLTDADGNVLIDFDLGLDDFLWDVKGKKRDAKQTLLAQFIVDAINAAQPVETASEVKI